MNFQVVGKITNIRIIAVNKSIRELPRLNKVYGKGRWRKLKGIANIRYSNGIIRLEEIHWYEAHGIGMKELKIKRAV